MVVMNFCMETPCGIVQIVTVFIVVDVVEIVGNGASASGMDEVVKLKDDMIDHGL